MIDEDWDDGDEWTDDDAADDDEPGTTVDLYPSGAMHRMGNREVGGDVGCVGEPVHDLDRELFALHDVEDGYAVHESLAAALADAVERERDIAIVQPCRVALPPARAFDAHDFLERFDDAADVADWSDFANEEGPLAETHEQRDLLEDMLAATFAKWVRKAGVKIRSWKLHGMPRKYKLVDGAWVEPANELAFEISPASENAPWAAIAMVDIRPVDYLTRITLDPPLELRGLWRFTMQYAQGEAGRVEIDVTAGGLFEHRSIADTTSISDGLMPMVCGSWTTFLTGKPLVVEIRNAGKLGNIRVMGVRTSPMPRATTEAEAKS